MAATQCGDAPKLEPPLQRISARTVTLHGVAASDFNERVVQINVGPWDNPVLLKKTSDDEFELSASPIPYYVTVALSGRGWSSVYLFGILVTEAAR